MATAAAGATGLADGEKALLEQDLSASFAGGALGKSVVGIGAGALAQAALFGAGHLNFGAHAADGVFERDFEVVAEVFALAGAGAATAATPAAAAKQVAEAEEVAEDIAEVAEGFRVEAGLPAGGAADALVAEAVVGGAFLGVGKDAVGFGGLLKLLLGRFIARIPVGVVLEGELPVGGLERSFVGALGQPEDLVVVPFTHRTATFTIAGRRFRPLKL